MKVINSFFNSCIDRFVTSSRYEFVTTVTFHFISNIDFLIWSSMRFRWISKLQFFVKRFSLERSFEFVSLSLHFNYLTWIRFEFALNLSWIISSSNFLLTWWSFLYSRIACLMHTQANINVVLSNESNRFWMCFNWINFKFISFQKININVCVIICAQNRTSREFISHCVFCY